MAFITGCRDRETAERNDYLRLTSDDEGASFASRVSFLILLTSTFEVARHTARKLPKYQVINASSTQLCGNETSRQPMLVYLDKMVFNFLSVTYKTFRNVLSL